MLPSQLSKRQSLTVLVPVILLVAVSVLFALRPAGAVPVRHPMLLSDPRSVEEAPRQGPPPHALFTKNGYEIEPLARFEMEARILRLEYYSKDREAELCPVDAVMGWGPMSRADIVNEFNIQQQNRWCYWESYHPPLTAEEVIAHSANMHFIPADDAVLRMLGKIRQFDIIRVHGYLVEARADDGWTWTSSLTREDTGNRSCEIIWVDRLEVVN